MRRHKTASYRPKTNKMVVRKVTSKTRTRKPTRSNSLPNPRKFF